MSLCVPVWQHPFFTAERLSRREEVRLLSPFPPRACRFGNLHPLQPTEDRAEIGESLQKIMRSNRRGQPRRVPQGFNFIQLEWDDGGQILNVSEGGLAFETFSPIPQADRVRFWFSFDLRHRIEAEGRIVWIDATNTVGGLRFVEVSQYARNQIRTWMSQNSAVASTAGIDQPTKGTNFDASGDYLRERGNADVSVPLHADSRDTAIGLRDAGPRGQATPEMLNGTHLVPLERYVSAKRSHFVRGILVGALASSIVASLAFKYLGLPQHRALVQGTTQPTSLEDSGVQNKSQAPSSDADAKRRSLTMASQVISQRSNTPKYDPDNPPQSSLTGNRLPSSATASVVNGARSTDLLASGESTRAKKSSATPQQLWASVQAGNAKAAVALADRYIHGDGVPVNCDQARVLLLVASEKNNKEAIAKLRDLDKDKTSCSVP